MAAEKCPCCDGWGKRQTIAANQPVWVSCTACDGDGVVYGPRHGKDENEQQEDKKKSA